MRETTEQPVEGSPSKRKKRESPRKKGRKQETSGSESDSDDHSPELSMAYLEVRKCVQLMHTPLTAVRTRHLPSLQGVPSKRTVIANTGMLGATMDR